MSGEGSAGGVAGVAGGRGLPAVNPRDLDPKLMAQIFGAVVEAEAAECRPEFQLIAFSMAREAGVAVGAQVGEECPRVGTETQRARATERVAPTTNRLEVQ